MPSDKKKSIHKKNEAKDQRKARDRKQSEKSEDRETSCNVEIVTEEELNQNSDANPSSWKRAIKSNWSKYEVPISDDVDESTTDNLEQSIESILTPSQSSGGFFKFKHERTWDEVAQESTYSKHFTIDLKELSRSICSVPFHERNNFKLDCFTQSDVKTMKSRAASFKSMKNVLEPNEKNLNNLIELLKTTAVEEEVLDDCEDLKVKKEEINKANQNVEQTLDKIEIDLNISPVKGLQSSDAEDLEQWLDDFLDT